MLKIIFLFLLSGGLPVAMAMAAASLIYLWMNPSSPPFVVIHRMVSGIDSFPLLAVPFFILAGNLMNTAGITHRIYSYALSLVGWLKGGLGHVNVVGRICRGRDGGIGHLGTDHSAELAICHLRHDGQCVGGFIVFGGYLARRHHGVIDDADRSLLCPQERLGWRCGV